MPNNAQSSHHESGLSLQRSPQGHFYTTHDTQSPGKLSTTLIHALADVMGTDVTDTSFVLYENVDPDALDRIFAETPSGKQRRNGHLAFTVDNYRVTVYSDGQIVITPPHQ